MESPLQPIILNQACHEIRRQFLSAEKAKRLLGYRPTTTLEEGMRGLADWVEESGGIERLVAS